MAKKKNDVGKVDLSDAKLKKHLAALGVTNTFDYHRWCQKHGFATGLDKSKAQREAELALFEREAAQKKVEAELARKIDRHPELLIERACAGDLDPSLVFKLGKRRFAEALMASNADGDSRTSLQHLLLLVRERADFLFEETRFGGTPHPFYKALIKINDRRGSWLRPLGDWKPSSHNRDRQFSALLRHLFALYEVPAFMDSVWFATGPNSSHQRDWFVHLGRGHNIRTAKTPFPLTKRMAHLFVQAPDSYTAYEALRSAQILALGGDRRLVEMLIASKLGTDFGQREFWETVIRFFIDNPMLDRRQVGPIIDFIHAQKFASAEIVVGPGQVEQVPPPQPGFTMRGRSPDTLLAQMRRWHQDLGRVGKAAATNFKRSGFAEYRSKPVGDDKAYWRIRELLSSDELIEEGRVLHHCVASYASSCAIGRCSIWSLERADALGVEKRQTVEVTKEGQIVQVRGKFNRMPSSSEFDVLRQWADATGLTVGPYVRVENW